MKKIILVICIIVFLLIIIFINQNNNKEIIMVCDFEADLVQSKSIQKYLFKGTKEQVEIEELSVELTVEEEKLIEDYQRILNENSECSNIKINGNTINYECHYDLINNHQYYKDIEEKDGTLKFSKLKNRLEEDNYVCFYK